MHLDPLFTMALTTLSGILAAALYELQSVRRDQQMQRARARSVRRGR